MYGVVGSSQQAVDMLAGQPAFKGLGLIPCFLGTKIPIPSQVSSGQSYLMRDRLMDGGLLQACCWCTR